MLCYATVLAEAALRYRTCTFSLFPLKSLAHLPVRIKVHRLSTSCSDNSTQNVACGQFVGAFGYALAENRHLFP